MNIKNLKEVQSRKLKSFHCTYRKLVAEISAATRLAYDEQKDKKKKKTEKEQKFQALFNFCPKSTNKREKVLFQMSI